VDVNAISRIVVNSAMRVHTALGPGLLESAYQACLAHELRNQGLTVQAEVPVPVVYEGLSSNVVTGWICSSTVPGSRTQGRRCTGSNSHGTLLSHLKLSGKKLGLLINFNVLHLKDGIKRVANGL
jgi:GxxExxY protein